MSSKTDTGILSKLLAENGLKNWYQIILHGYTHDVFP